MNNDSCQQAGNNQAEKKTEINRIDLIIKEANVFWLKRTNFYSFNRTEFGSKNCKKVSLN